MNSKERVLTALNHEEPDRVPIDLGGWVTTISQVSYNKLLSHLGYQREREVFDWLRQNVAPEEDILQRLGVDTRYVHPGEPVGWKFEPEETKDGLWVNDEWGCGFLKPESSLYYNLMTSPLRDASIDDLDSYPWPDPKDPGYITGVKERAKQLAEDGEYAVIGNFAWETWFERAWKLRGIDKFYMDFVTNPDFINKLLDKTLSLHLEFLDHVLGVCGEYLDVVIQGGDLGSQQTTLMSPQHYREYIKPRQAQAVEKIRSLTGAKIFYHTCGAVSSLVPDFIEIGIDILNPVQVRANGMDAETLKKEFGGKIAFWGGIDSQQVLPRGTVNEVVDEVKHLINHMATGGGLVACAVHNIQADVPPENVLALFDSVRELGTYPISVIN